MVESIQPISARDWRLRLIRWLGLTPVPADVAGAVAALRATVDALTQAQTANQATIAALRETLDRLERQIGRSGKEQFKANALAEVQQQTVKTLLEQLREAEGYRERELASLRERLTAARRDSRMEIIGRLLPVADGLGEAVAAGERISELANQRIGESANQRIGESASQQVSESANQRIGKSTHGRLGRAWARLWRRVGSEARGEPSGGMKPAEASSPEADDRSRPGELAAWLEGLKFVQDRLLDLLAAEGVRPIEAEGDTFDPYLYVVVETVVATDRVPAGTIVREIRRGYLAGETVLRYAEVVVAR
ncbi:MAG: nucleotide exchange factor GrpE [Chloroflexi bacterium]|nr:nucleotide exchange factor GrpE [Chloroflexota bacterium]